MEDGVELAGDRELQRLAALGVLDADGHGRHIDLRPGEGDHLGEAHAHVESEAECVADNHVAHRGLEATVPAWQYLRRWVDASTARRVQAPACGAPVLDRIAQLLEVVARSAVDGCEQLHGGVRLDPAGPFGQFPESLLDVAAVDLVKGTAKPVAGILVHGTAVARDGAFPAPGCDGNPVPEGLAQGRDGTGARTSREGGLAQGDAAEDLPGAQRPADHLRQPSRARRHGHRLPHPAPALRQVGRRPPGRAAGEVAARDPDQRRPPLPHPRASSSGRSGSGTARTRSARSPSGTSATTGRRR